MSTEFFAEMRLLREDLDDALSCIRAEYAEHRITLLEAAQERIALLEKFNQRAADLRATYSRSEP